MVVCSAARRINEINEKRRNHIEVEKGAFRASDGRFLRKLCSCFFFHAINRTKRVNEIFVGGEFAKRGEDNGLA